MRSGFGRTDFRKEKFPYDNAIIFFFGTASKTAREKDNVFGTRAKTAREEDNVYGSIDKTRCFCVALFPPG